ncbi:phage major capsid protein [Caloramator sp. E03]|uniref:phage major capsid protein n=1 Tax=Caloramator sp. E03 TaxID=2576307 RepID=UPI0011101434|nr:phage major capsid protein [Caloramator sp. E03]QCX34665.1 phage major capsid protein [Caloramator sp. E03]
MDKIKEMQAKREELRLKAVELIEKAEREGRYLTEEEEQRIKEYEEGIKRWDDTIENVRKFMVVDTVKDREPIQNESVKDEKRFNSFGEQLMAVYRAAAPDGKVDSRLTTRAALGLNESVPSDGGFLVQKDFVSELLKRTYETGILASRVRRIPISTNSNGLKINAVDETSRANGSRWGGVQTYWENEAEQIISSKPKFRTMDLSLKKLTGLCYATDELLQDAAALESVIRQAFAEEFGFKIDDAIINGTGSGQPLGILNSDALVKVSKDNGQTDIITVENLLNMWARLWARSRSNAVWFVNQELEPILYTLKVGDKPVYIPAGGLSEAPYATLLGRPVVPIEQCSQVGEIGDIILADMSQYLLIDKGGINAASSIHVRFLYDENVFRFIYRVDGQPLWNKPLMPYKGSGAISPFVALAKRN